MRRIVVSSVLLVLVAGCSSILDPRERSIILPITQIDVPSTVAPGASFTATFIVQSGGCKRFDHVEATRTATALIALAHGRETVGKNIACTDDIRFDTVEQVVSPPVSDPFSVVGRQPDGTETTVQVRVQ